MASKTIWEPCLAPERHTKAFGSHFRNWKAIRNAIEDVLNAVEDVRSGLLERVAKVVAAELSGGVNQAHPCGHDRLKIRIVPICGLLPC